MVRAGPPVCLWEGRTGGSTSFGGGSGGVGVAERAAEQPDGVLKLGDRVLGDGPAAGDRLVDPVLDLLVVPVGVVMQYADESVAFHAQLFAALELRLRSRLGRLGFAKAQARD